MNETNQNLRYFGYVRKSTDRLDRQALSVASQIQQIRERFPNMKIVKIYEEKVSAFHPGKRPVFLEMCERIEKSEADGIVSWHPNRLSRNAVDAGYITHSLQTKTIKDLQFGNYNFDNSPEGIWMLQMALSQGQYESAKLSKEVMRGTTKKAEMGHMPARAKIGYLNSKGKAEKGSKYIYPDPKRFDMVRKMWEMMLTGNYTPGKIADIASNEWGFRTPKTKSKKPGRGGGVPITAGTLYKIFSCEFYSGYYHYNGKRYDGKHKAMVTQEEFNRVQELLGRPSKIRPTKHSFPFTGFVRCGECNCLMTAETKTKYIKSTGETRSYTYYHCTRKRRDIDCSQRRNILAEDLEQQFKAEISKYIILPEFRDLALKILRREHKSETKSQTKILEAQQKTQKNIKKRLSSLLDMKLADKIDDDDYEEKRLQLKKELSLLESQLRSSENRAEQWLELTEQVFNFATFAFQKFITGDDETKRSLLLKLGQNLIIVDGKLQLEAKRWYAPIGDNYPALQAQYLKVRTENKDSAKAKTDALTSVSPKWRAIWDSNPGHGD